MKVAFFKGKYGDLKHKVTSWCTFGPYSHCELVLNDGLCISSTPEDGVRCKVLEFDEQQWDFIEFEASDTKDLLVFKETLNLVGQPYSWKKIYLSRWFAGKVKTWSCSELIAFLLITKGLYDLDTTVCSPNYLFRQMYKQTTVKIVAV